MKWMEAEKNESILYPGLLVDCTQDGLSGLSLIFFDSNNVLDSTPIS